MGNLVSNKKINPNNTKFILGIIDPQYDFFKGGSLAVPYAEEIIGPINKLRFYCALHMHTFISQDFHPIDHMSFASVYKEKPFTKKNLTIIMSNKDHVITNQILWPDHCIRNNHGCEFHKDLIHINSDYIFRKGTHKNVESYSAFGDEYGGKYEDTGLYTYLKNNNVSDIVIVGLATDYCVYNTILDAINYGFKVHLIMSCTRGVSKDSTDSAISHISNLNNIMFYNDVHEFIKYYEQNHKN
jgi:nicotinamidase/pyrazinamidase